MTDIQKTKQDINNLEILLKQKRQSLSRQQNGVKRAELKAELGNLSVHSLRKAGWKVLVTHTRYLRQSTENGNILVPCPSSLREFASEFQPTGGTTFVSIEHPKSEEVYTAGSICHQHDNFDRKIGVALALLRLKEMAELNIPAESKTEEVAVAA